MIEESYPIIKESYPFLDYINEDKRRYKTASEAGFCDPDNDFLIGESGGFLMNINAGDKFIDTHLLTEHADYYKNHGVFHPFIPNSLQEQNWRRAEEYKRRNGFRAPCRKRKDGTIEEIRITGSHYNFINYCVIEQLDESSVRKGIKTGAKHKAIAKFIDAQYWTFKIMEFCENNGFFLLIVKTRRGGFSYIMAMDSANYLNLQPHKNIIHVAAKSDYLTTTGGLSDFANNQLVFYQNNTPFKRGLASIKAEEFSLGFKNMDGSTPLDSWNSTIFSVSAFSNPNCAIGKDAVKIKVEEISTMGNFDDFMYVTEPTMRTGSYTTGTLYGWGTNTSGNIQVFEQNFYDPGSSNFMAFENVWDKDSRHEVCGYFKPYCWGLQGELDGKKALDEDGNSDIETSLEIARIERETKKNESRSFKKFIHYCGQYALYPSESFSSVSENVFVKPELLQWEEELRTNRGAYQFYTDGIMMKEGTRVIFKSNERVRAEGLKVYNWIENVPRKAHEDAEGCVRIWFHPQTVKGVVDNKIEEVVPQGLYSITYDPVGINKDKNELTSKHSHNSIHVWMNPDASNGYKPKCVAAYYGRPNTLEEADKIFYYLAVYYNCVGASLPEVDRGETISNFKKWNATKYLKKEPVYIWDSSVKGKTEGNYGVVIGTGDRKLTAVRAGAELLYTKVGVRENGEDMLYLHTIYDYQLILEFKKWSTVGNFDRVSEFLVQAINWMSMDIRAEEEMQRRRNLESEENTEFLNRQWY